MIYRYDQAIESILEPRKSCLVGKTDQINHIYQSGLYTGKPVSKLPGVSINSEEYIELYPVSTESEFPITGSW